MASVTEPPGLSIHRQTKFTSRSRICPSIICCAWRTDSVRMRSLQIDADGPPTALQRRIVLDGRRRQLQRLDQLPPIGGQVAGEAQSPGLAAGELAQLAGPLHHDRLLGRVLLSSVAPGPRA